MLRPVLGHGQRNPEVGVSSGVLPRIHAWELVRTLSPRSHVRLSRALPDGSPSPENTYPLRHNVAGPAPSVPWAMHLADDDGHYHYLVFDLDSHGGTADASRDMATLVALLERLGTLPYVVCESSPDRGYHVWIALSEALPADEAAQLARTAKRLLPSLDTTPLNKAGTGAVRTPGAPHRFGGVSTVLYGDTRSLVSPTADRAAVAQFNAALTAEAPTPVAPAYEDLDGIGALTLVDELGHRHLPGQKVSLGPKANDALFASLTAHQDASAVLFTALLGAARARWRYDDMRALLDTAPGLEHARTRGGASPSRRIARSQHEAERILARQWARAVAVASTTRPLAAVKAAGLDERCDIAARIFEEAQAHANASPGRWSPPPYAGRRAAQQSAVDRAVLDELHRIALHSLQVNVGASIRTLAQRLPVGKEAVRRAVLRLAQEGWIRQVEPAAGVAAAVWSIDPDGVFHSRATSTRPLGGPAPLRRQLLEAATTAQRCTNHDAFTSHGLGYSAGRTYAALLPLTRGSTVPQLALLTGTTPEHCRSSLERLALAGAAWCLDGRWHAREAGVLDAIAAEHGVTGTLAERAWRYQAEQATWAYFQAELEALRSPILRQRSATRLIALGSKPAVALGPYPRRHDGRLDWPTAKELVTAMTAA